MDIKERIKKLPLSSGVYIMKSQHNEVLYIGKASSLRKRVNSHFVLRKGMQTHSFLNKVAEVSFITCDTPQQALILEAALIKEKKPKHNIALRDSKSYPYIEITNEDFPRVFISRPKKNSKNFIFGPYPQTKVLKSALLLMRNIFPYRSCKNMGKTSCLFFHLNMCLGPCVGKVSVIEYRQNIKNIREILTGRRKQVIEGLKIKMRRAAKNLQFEQAKNFRDKLLAVDILYKGKPRTHEIIFLKEALKLPSFPLVIEAVDISSLGRDNSVGSVVVFNEGLPDKSSYRRFRIKKANSQDDYAMIAEVLKRRYLRMSQEKRVFPDLLIIDGGRGHLSTALKVLNSLGVSVPVISIAKENEEIWLPQCKCPLVFSRSNSSLHLIQRIRDEAHRFAGQYQKFLHEKKLLPR